MSDELERMARACAWMGLGAFAMYLLDPESGRRRRALLLDKLTHELNVTGEALSSRARDAANRGYGVVMETRSRFTEREVPDELLAERARAAMGHATSHAGDVELSVRAGVVFVRGEVPPGESEGIVSAISGVPGVREVQNLLEVNGSGAPQAPNPAT